MKSLPYFHNALFRYVLLVVFVPITLIVAYNYYQLYGATFATAQTDINTHSRNQAFAIDHELLKLSHSAAQLGQLKPLSEVPVNILYSQNALLALQGYVEEEPLVTAAFVQDDSGFIIEGYPIDTLRIESRTLLQRSLRLMQHNYTQVNPELFWLPNSQINNFWRVDERPSGYLLYSVPLFAETDSIVSPYEATGALYFVINAQKLVQQGDKGQSDFGDHAARLVLAEQVIAKENEATFKNFLLAETRLTTPIWKNGEEMLMLLRTQHDSTYYKDRFWRATFTEVLPLILVLPLIAYALRMITQRLNQPLAETVELCRSFVSGNYQPKPIDSHYQEFDLLVRRLNTMAMTINEQIENLRQAKDRAEKSEQIKGQFLANMSHEIRTPMNGVLGMLQLLKTSGLTKEQERKIEIATNSAKNLLGIINDILDISKIEANKIDIESIHCDVLKLLQEQVDALQEQAGKRGNKLTLFCDDNFTPCWLTDPTRVSQISNNLISNALKFTRDGRVTVVLSQIHNRFIQIKVEDSGIGIAPDKLETLFQPFNQADASTTREYGGTGLGLSISKNLCELMDGSLTVESEVDEGSIFTATIAAQAIETKQAVEAPKQQQPDNEFEWPGRYVLIAEDNDINREVIKAMLEPCKLDIRFADHGQQAIEMVSKETPDLVLMDVHMPVMDGVTATKALRQSNVKVPIIMQTANVMSEDVDAYQEAGADGVISKPFVKADLLTTLAKWLQHSA